jgi:hypothetical protein
MPLVKITSDAIAAGAIGGSALGLNSISTNNIVTGAVAANTLASNLSISVSRISETLNINATVIGDKSASGANVNIDVLNTTVYYFSSNTSGNVTLNLRGNTTTIFDQAVQIGNTISVVVTLRNNVTAGRAGANVMIDGGLIATNRGNPDIAAGNLIYYAGNTAPTFSSITAMENNIVGLTIIKKAANSYMVMLSNSLFGLV